MVKHLHCGIGDHVVLASQFGLQSLTPLFVAVCGRLPLGVVNWATSVALLK